MIAYGAKIKLMKLLRGDDGAAIPITLVVFLVFVLMVMSVCALGYNIREKMELQNATDNAAYAGAVAQSDVLSRMAVLNRAMAWTYVQVNRMHTDYIMNRWLAEVRSEFFDDCKTTMQNNIKHSRNGCSRHNIANGLYSLYLSASEYTHSKYRSGMYGVNECYYVGNSSGHGMLNLYGASNSSAREANVYSKQTGGTQYTTLAPRIVTASNNLRILNESVANLKNNMFSFVESAIRDSIGKNVRGAEFIAILGEPAGNANYTRRTSGNLTVHTGNPSQAFEKINNESEFFGAANSTGNHYRSSNGAWNRDGWNKLYWWTARNPSNDNDGFYRQYTGTHRLSWSTGYGVWHCRGMMGCMGYIKWGSNSSTLANAVTGSYYAGDGSYSYLRGYPAKPWRMKRTFFGKGGTIIVGAKRTLTNPFASGILDGETDNRKLGFYGAFAIPDTDIWTVSASRAGVRIPGGATGAYETTWMGTGATWNLFADDWDAVMLPLAKAWKTGTNRVWGTGADASDILIHVRDSLNVNSALPITSEVNKDVIY